MSDNKPPSQDDDREDALREYLAATRDMAQVQAKIKRQQRPARMRRAVVRNLAQHWQFWIMAGLTAGLVVAAFLALS